MIFGEIGEIKFYKGISTKLDKAIEIIESGEYKNKSLGKHVVDGDNLFFNIQECQTKKLDECFFEDHNKYIDIHIVIEGEEGIGYSLKHSLNEKSVYDAGKDLRILEGNEQYRFNMDKNNFFIVFPNEPHMPLIARDNNPTHLKKVVFKIKY